MKICKVFMLACILLFTVGNVSATEIIHRPINPSFVGSDGFRGSHLLNSATMQNDHKEEVTKLTPLEQFQESLQRNLLQSITSKMTRDMYGEEGFKPGHYSYAGMEVDVIGGVDGVTITIHDTANGGTTTVTVPNY